MFLVPKKVPWLRTSFPSLAGPPYSLLGDTKCMYLYQSQIKKQAQTISRKTYVTLLECSKQFGGENRVDPIQYSKKHQMQFMDWKMGDRCDSYFSEVLLLFFPENK